MVYYLIVSLPFIVFFTRLGLTNVLIPFNKKKSLYKQMQKRIDWPRIQSIEQTLQTLFKGSHGKIISFIYRKIRGVSDKEFIYGEIDFLSFHNILEQTQPKLGEVFYDLGSGTGKAVFSAGLFYSLSKSCGIELLPPLYEKAANQLKKLVNFTQALPLDSEYSLSEKISSIQFINDSFLNYDFYDANIIYVAATCLNHATWENLITKMTALKTGTRIIVATKSIEYEEFDLIYQGTELMSWGLCPIKIYKKC